MKNRCHEILNRQDTFNEPDRGEGTARQSRGGPAFAEWPGSHGLARLNRL